MCLTDLSGCELISLASIFSITIAKNLSNEEISILGDSFSDKSLLCAGDNLSLISSNSTYIKNTRKC